MHPPTVLYEDNHLLVVVKEAGLLAQGDATGDASLLDLCKEYIREKYAKPGDVFLGLVHRLDRPVSGVMAFARTSKAAARLSAQFRGRSVRKLYWAVVEGRPAESAGLLRHWLAESAGERKSTVRQEPEAGAREASLRYRVLATETARALLEIELLTGYKHQIRAQLAAMGCPVVGDFKYDTRPQPARVERVFEGRAIALHARELALTHPTRKEPVVCTAPLPPYWPFRT